MTLTYIASQILPVVFDYFFESKANNKGKDEESVMCRFSFIGVVIFGSLQIILGILTQNKFIGVVKSVFIASTLTGIVRSIKYKLLDTFRDMTFVNKIKDKR